MTKSLIIAASGFILFCAAYLLINEQILVQSILYRAAASDYDTAVTALLVMAFQATALLIGVIMLSRRLFSLLLILIAISAATNVIYSAILDDIIDLAKFDWLLTEARHAGNAAGKFTIPAIIGLAKLLLALGLFAASRKLFRMSLPPRTRMFRPRSTSIVALLALLLPSIMFSLSAPGPIAAERNVYSFAYEKLTLPPPPPRREVALAPRNSNQSIDKILWIVDESVSYDGFAKLLETERFPLQPVNFGKAAAMANCSAPAHVALRAGVDVLGVNAVTDLRRTPSIWAYARKAGYRTVLIDGQVSGPPQNLLLPPEASIIDEIHPVAAGMKTDLKIAKDLNTRLKSSGKKFIYAVLRGVHFQYSDHYPADFVPATAPLSERYEAAITYSKRGFFRTLLADLDQEKVAIIYTSDHGQNVKQNVLPHCSPVPVKSEFAIPLLAFLPQAHAEQYPEKNISGNRYSASQIFPSTLTWMGYDRDAVTENYDNTLAQPTKKFVWFGRSVIPIRDGDAIRVSMSNSSPAE